MKIKKLTAILMSVILCFLVFTPVYAIIPNGSIAHTVKILKGEGKILKNKDTTYNGEGVERYISLSSLDDLEEVEQVEYSVVDGENLKDMLDYSNCDGSVYTASFDDNLIAKLIDIPSDLRPKWRETAFITSTRVVNHYFSLIEASGLTLTSGYTDIAQYLPTGIKQLLFFVPPNEEYSFSHFVDQYGNVVTVNSSITKDLILTPVYTTEYVEDILDKTEEKFHQVRFLSGEGKIEYVKLSYDSDNYVGICDGYTEIDHFDDIVIDGQSYNFGYSNYTYDDVIQSYAIFQGHDFPVAFNLLQSKETDVVAYLNEQNLYDAIIELDDAITIASKFMFSSPYYYQENVRPYSISLLAFLSNFTVNNQTLSDILINLLADLEDAYLQWSSYTNEEKETFITECLNSIAAFENTANRFVSNYYSYMAPKDEKSYRISANRGDWGVGWGFRDINTIYYESVEVDRSLLYDYHGLSDKVVFIPPSRNYEFDYFIDQYGNVFDPTTPVTEDLVLTPIYKEIHEYHLTFTQGEGELRIMYKYWDDDASQYEKINSSINSFSYKLWRGTYSYNLENNGFSITRESSSYTDSNLRLHGTNFDESILARSSYESLTYYNDYDHLWFIPPDNCVFDHFEDENGDVWEYGTELIKDTTVTPIYRSILVDSIVNVVTEDNSDEDFNLCILREYKKTLEDVFDKGDYEGSLHEYLNDKNSYTFIEDDWEITEDGYITNYTGELIQMLGIPESVNGITVTGVATDAFESLYERYYENYTGPHQSEAQTDYYNNPIAIWIPKTITNFSDGIDNAEMVEQYKTQAFEYIREELSSQGKTDEEIETALAYYENIITVSIESTGHNNCTPLVYLPLCYTVVEKENRHYTSLAGSLYDKDYETLLSLSCAARLDSLNYYYNNYTLEDIGLEIPKSVKTISAFATYSAIKEDYTGYYPIYAYGNTNLENFIEYLVVDVTFPDENLIDNFYLEKFEKTFNEIQEMIVSFENPPAEVEQSFDETMSIAFIAAQEAGLVDENGDPLPLVSYDELIPFVLSYYASWLDSYPEYRFNEFAMMISTFVEGIFDPATNEQLVSDDELFAWQTTYIETYSDGAVTLDSNGELVPNLTEEDKEEIQAITAHIAAQNDLNLEDSKELICFCYSITTFVLVTNPENAAAARRPFSELLSVLNPNATTSQLQSYWEMFNMFVQTNTELDGKINRYGLVNRASPFVSAFKDFDSYSYIAYLTDVPDRYIQPNTVEIVPSDVSSRSGTIYLMLKRGGVDIVTYDENDNSVFLEATYSILDADNNVVGTIITRKDGTAVQLGNLTYGSYSVIQTSVEDGYSPNISVERFEITEDGDLIHLSFSNTKVQTLYSVKIPKTVILSGQNGLGVCTISVIGKLQNNQSVTVRPITSTFNLIEQNASVDIKAPIAATVTQTKSVWTSSDLSEDTWSSANVTISAPITAGAWKGILGIEIVLSVN